MPEAQRREEREAGVPLQKGLPVTRTIRHRGVPAGEERKPFASDPRPGLRGGGEQWLLPHSVKFVKRQPAPSFAKMTVPPGLDGFVKSVF